LYSSSSALLGLGIRPCYYNFQQKTHTHNVTTFTYITLCCACMSRKHVGVRLIGQRPRVCNARGPYQTVRSKMKQVFNNIYSHNIFTHSLTHAHTLILSHTHMHAHSDIHYMWAQCILTCTCTLCLAIFRRGDYRLWQHTKFEGGEVHCVYYSTLGNLQTLKLLLMAIIIHKPGV
jgi:hypothetical protein